jgi:hypothetical protein
LFLPLSPFFFAFLEFIKLVFFGREAQFFCGKAKTLKLEETKKLQFFDAIRFFSLSRSKHTSNFGVSEDRRKKSSLALF